ncbi:MAG: hypothetical protein ABI076_11455 [Acidobacteriaceae bacterium]
MLTTARIHAPIADYEHLQLLSDADKNELLKTLSEIFPPRAHSIEICEVEFVVDVSAPTDSNKDLIAEIEAQRVLMISVATGGQRIQSVDNDYKARRAKIQRMLEERGLAESNPFTDLWAWYGKWSSGDLPSYQSRRQFVTSLYAPLIDQLNGVTSRKSSGIFDSPTGWAKVDRTMSEVRQRLAEASTEEQFQAVGLLCREALISLAQTVFEPKRHPVLDGVLVSKTDAKRMLEAYLAVELAGGENKIARQHARAALDLTNELQHKRTAAFRQAALCSESTAAVVNLIAILSGQRDP